MIIKPHNKKAREVKQEDLQRVLDDAINMYESCFEKHGNYNGGHAIAHTQVEEVDPLRFFVTRDGDCIINPIITRHTKFEQQHLEGCLSYNDKPEVRVGRYYRVEVEYYVFDEDAIDDGEHKLIKKQDQLKGMPSYIFQHEIDHLNGLDIYHK